VNGLLRWFADNHVAANLLMVFVAVSGLLAVGTIKKEVFPEVDLDMVSIQVPYLGASPEDVEQAVCIRVEEAIQGIDGIKRITSTAVEGLGTTVAEIETDADPQQVLDDIKQAVDRIVTFPEETEKPNIRLMQTTEQAVDLIVYGQTDEWTLARLAERIRDDLLTDPDLTQATLVGVRPYEISIEVSERTLRRYGLTLAQVTEAVRRGSLDLPAGSVKTDHGDILVRTKGQRYTAREFADLVVLARPDGGRVTLDQIAEIHDGFADIDQLTRFDGEPAVMITVYRVGDQSILDVTDAVHRFVAENQGLLPAGVKLAVWADRSIIYRGRMDLMLKNGLYGLVLVFVCLALFLQLRLAFWVALGIPVAFLGGLWLIPSFGASLNMITMFAFIVVLGMVVDDAIVIGENVYTHRERGLGPRDGAIAGVTEVAAPVVMSSLTTMVAFYPLAGVAGTMGKFMRVIPVVVIAVLAVSLVEALLVLPAHLSTVPDAAIGTDPERRGFWPTLRRGFDRRFRYFVERIYRPALAWSLAHRGTVIALSVASILLLLGFVGGGHIRFTLMPKVDADNMICAIDMPVGTGIAESRRAVAQAVAALDSLRAELAPQREAAGEPILRHVFTTIGFQPRSSAQRQSRPGKGEDETYLGANRTEINVELMPAEHRPVGSEQLVRRWRELTGPIPGAKSVTFTANLFHGSAPLEIQLSSRDVAELTEAADRLKVELSRYPGVQDITDSYEPGKQELKLKLKPQARTLGLTLADLAAQVRHAFYGDEAMRIQRGRDEVKVMVRFPRDERRSLGDIEGMRIRTPAGGAVPFTRVAEVSLGRGYATINRMDRRRIVSVRADIDQKTANADEILADLRRDFLPRLLADYPDLRVSFEGQSRDQAESMDSLRRGFLVAIIGIFALLAVQFRSYTQPAIIMTAIPFGLLGAVLGHVAMGWDLTLLSLFGVVALSGVVVNDSLVMVDFINRARQGGMPVTDAVVQSGVRRFRPIVLTSVTTFAGLTPMLLEKSLQARFLIPMAISLGFGVLFATLITLILVPVLYSLLESFHGRREAIRE